MTKSVSPSVRLNSRAKNLNFERKLAYPQSLVITRHYPDVALILESVVGMTRMNLRGTADIDKIERLACATRLLSEAQTILETVNCDVAAAYIQMAVDQCGEPQAAADTEKKSHQDT